MPPRDWIWIHFYQNFVLSSNVKMEIISSEDMIQKLQFHKGGLISRSIFNLVPSSKNKTKNHAQLFHQRKKKVEDNDFTKISADRLKLKRASDIEPSLDEYYFGL